MKDGLQNNSSNEDPSIIKRRKIRESRLNYF